jgi:hypothetical protein
MATAIASLRIIAKLLTNHQNQLCVFPFLPTADPTGSVDTTSPFAAIGKTT